MSVMSSPSGSSVARRLPFHFVSTKLICECVGLKERFGVPSDREDPVSDGDGGEDTTRRGGSIECRLLLLISNVRSFVPLAHCSFLVLVSLVIFVVVIIVVVVVV